MSGTILKFGDADIKIRIINYSKELISNDEGNINKSLNSDTIYFW